jgi:hypothetical protein
VPPGEGQADRSDDGHRGGDHGAERGEDRDDDEHHPRDERHPAPHHPDRGLHQPVDRPVVLGDGEQVGDADEDDEQVRREVGQHLVGNLLADHEAAEDEQGHESQRAHVHR